MHVSITTASLLLAVNIWFCSNFNLVSGEKPHCKGQPLESDEFSKEDEVGFVRDLLVDVLARNFYNLVNHQVSNLCEDLANVRTSTCFRTCHKWKRSSFFNKRATKGVMTKAEALVEHFNLVVSNEVSLNNIDDEKILLGYIEDVKFRLYKSGAANEESKIMVELENMKKNFCKHYLLDQIQRKEAEKKEIEHLSENKDVSIAIHQFVQSFETKDQVQITNHWLEVNVVKAGDNFQSGIIRLKIEYNKGGVTKFSSVILKVPSLSVLPFEILKKTNMFDREVHFYTNILPEMYRLGECEPFAPVLYTATQAGALVLEDLTVEGYKPGDRMKQLDINEAMEFLNVLAIYHALGYKYLQTLSKDDPSRSLIASDQPILRELKSRTKKPTFEKFCEMIKPHLDESLYQRIVKLENKVQAEPEIITSAEKNSIIVLMHADCRANNILFKYNDKGICTKVKLIDWQVSKEGSPVIDLIYFFITSVDMEVFQVNENKLLTNYLKKLNTKLKLLGNPNDYTPEDLAKDLALYKYYYVSVLSLILPKFLGAGSPGKVTDFYVSCAIKWLNYLERKKFI